MPTLPDYLGASRIQTESLAFPYKSPISQIKQIKAHKMHVSDIFCLILGIFWGKFFGIILMNF